MAFSIPGTVDTNVTISWKNKCRIAFIKTDLFCRNSILQMFAWLLYKKDQQPVKKILIFRTGSLGDNICAVPAIAAIRQHYPEARITILANAGAANLVSMENIADPGLYENIIDYLGMDKKKLFRVLKDAGFDMVIQLPQREARFTNLIRDIFFFRLIAKKGWGWSISTVWYCRKTQEKYIHFLNETDTLLEILRKNGVPAIKHNAYPLHLTNTDEIFVTNLFQEHQLNSEKKILAIIVGAKRPQNRWPIQYFKEVIESVAGRYAIVLIGGKEDLQAVQILEQFPGVVNFCGQLTPMQSAQALKKCTLTISNDTGPMHLSYAVGTPVIALFSSRDFPGRWYPPNNGVNRIFRTENVHCAICLSDTCTNNICMQAIKPAQVIEAINELLAAR